MSMRQISTYEIGLGVVRVERAGAVTRRRAGDFSFGNDRAEPWRRHHVAASLALAAIGCLGMFVCWYVGAGRSSYHDQVPWLVGSIASAGVAVTGGVVWLVCGFRQVSLLERALLGYLGPWLDAAQADPVRPAGDPDTGSLVIAAGMSRAHRPGCLLVRGKSHLTVITQAEVSVRGLPTCGVCKS